MADMVDPRVIKVDSRDMDRVMEAEVTANRAMVVMGSLVETVMVSHRRDIPLVVMANSSRALTVMDNRVLNPRLGMGINPMASSALTDSSQVVVVVEEGMGNPVAHMEALKVATGDAMMGTAADLEMMKALTGLRVTGVGGVEVMTAEAMTEVAAEAHPPVWGKSAHP